MILVIAEKPSVAQSIAKVLGAASRKDGYLEGNDYIVSWCVGHLVGLADASSYDERYAKWRYDDLPIVPEEWLFEVPKDKAQQFKVLRDLMKDKRMESSVMTQMLEEELRRTLTDKQLDIYLCCLLGGLSYKDYADTKGVSYQSVQQAITLGLV